MDFDKLSQKLNSVLNLNTSNIIQWNSKGDAGQVINYAGKSYTITHSFLSNTKLLLTNSGQAIPEHLASDSSKVLSEKVLLERNTKSTPYHPKKVSRGFVSLVAVYEDDLVKFKLYGLQDSPITVFEIPQQDEPILEITGPTTLSDSGTVASAPGGVFPEKIVIGCIFSNARYKLNASLSSSVSYSGTSQPPNIVSAGSSVRINPNIGLLNQAAGSSTSSGNDSDSVSGFRYIYGSQVYRLVSGASRSPGFASGRGGFSFTTSAEISTEIIDCPMLYQARMFINGDLLHIVVSYGLRFDESYNVSDSFLTQDGNLLCNEINTFPGFTRISMYPRLWGLTGITYAQLLDRDRKSVV
jgi:hypothetical protein